MMRLVLWSLLLVAMNTGSLAAAEPSPFLSEVRAALKRKDIAGALERIHARDAAAAEVPQALWEVAQTRVAYRWNRHAIPSLQEIAERHPKHPLAASAWLQLGLIHAEREEQQEMVAALEQGLALRPVIKSQF